MKRFIIILMTLACSLSVSVNAFAASKAPVQAQDGILYIDKAPKADTPVSDDMPAYLNAPDKGTYREEPGNNESSRLPDGKYSNIVELFEYWEQKGYPDYVGGVVSTDGSMNNLTVLLVNDDGTKEEQIRALLADHSGVSFGTAAYSHNAMKAVSEEITANYMGSGNKVYSVGIGWTSADGKVTGFGESRKESRVVVSVDESVLTEYKNKFYKLYGDMVVVEAGGAPILLDDSTAANNLWLSPLLISMIVIAGAGILFYNRIRLIPAIQTAKGTVVTQSAAVSTKETIAAIKDSEISPSDEVFKSILSKIEEHNA
ncbi:hypothetical protein OXPF_42450 [Oxobacter pfennigii]|uniref:TPM domain-containing protein n=1 Tax=Oxobacter pfennigii TaxID=36849 RepID=A0A0P8YS39_9CLOT|nr:hypothetical protein [Oxobacter pfennigii]KPU42460.1 hypothetical protein OXPF_42450 [Oxobacter pfennigii]